MENEIENEIVIDIADERLANWKIWADQILAGNDPYWEQMGGRTLVKDEMDDFLGVAARNAWKMDTQQAFRTALFAFRPFQTKKAGQSIPRKKSFNLDDLKRGGGSDR